MVINNKKNIPLWFLDLFNHNFSLGTGWNPHLVRSASSCCVCSSPGRSYRSDLLLSYLDSLIYTVILPLYTLQNLDMRPYTAYVKSNRARRLCAAFPKYDEDIVSAFSRGDSLSAGAVTAAAKKVESKPQNAK